MDVLQDLFASGHACDIALACILIEAIVLLRGSGKRGALAPLDVVGQLAAGALLLLAVRCALVRTDYRIVAALLTASFPAHVFDLARRRRRAVVEPSSAHARISS